MHAHCTWCANKPHDKLSLGSELDCLYWVENAERYWFFFFYSRKSRRRRASMVPAKLTATTAKLSFSVIDRLFLNQQHACNVPKAIPQ